MMLKVIYSEVVKDFPSYSRPSVVERTKTFNTISEAVQFSKYIANTTHVVGKPLIKDAD
jgi:hypothetical protein